MHVITESAACDSIVVGDERCGVQEDWFVGYNCSLGTALAGLKAARNSALDTTTVQKLNFHIASVIELLPPLSLQELAFFDCEAVAASNRHWLKHLEQDSKNQQG